MKSIKTNEQFIFDANQVHGNKYNYSKVTYQGHGIPVEIICPIHGSFLQTPTNHLLGHGCVKCKAVERGKLQRKTTETFIEQAKNIHGDKYNYSKTIYINKRSKVCITCPVHGDFWQNAQSHLNGCGCKECMKERFRITLDDFVRRAKDVHGDKYDYSLITNENFNGVSSQVDIVCKEHGVFVQIGYNHLNGKGCRLCANIAMGKSLADTKIEFVKKAISAHGNKYLYDKVVYINQGIDVCITCPIHGDFFQRPSHHLNGAGCPMCKRSFGEERVAHFLKQNNIEFKEQFCFNNEYLFCGNIRLMVDFYLPQHNIVIEYNGGQHYKSIDYFGGQKALERQQERDMAVRQYCKEHKIRLIEIPYTEFDNIETILNKQINRTNK